MEKMTIENFKQQIIESAKWYDMDLNQIEGNDIPEFVLNVAKQYKVALRFYNHNGTKEYDMRGKLNHDNRMITLKFSVLADGIKVLKDKNLKPSFIPQFNTPSEDTEYLVKELIGDKFCDWMIEPKYYQENKHRWSLKRLISEYGGYSCKPITIMKHFMYNNIGIETENIKMDEFNVIKLANLGPLLYAKKGVVSNCYMYDINSSYPNILQSDDFMFPIKKGYFATLDKAEGFGFFKINLLNESKIDYRIFKTNKTKWFTHIDIKILENNGYEYELCDEVKNAYVYDPSSLISSKFLFKKMIDKLYEMKADKNKSAKLSLNVVWGFLCQVITKTFKLSDDNIQKFTEEEIFEMHPKKCNMKVLNKDQPFATGFARMKPFILAQGRYNLSKAISKCLKKGYDVYRVHTDSLMTNMKPKKFCKIALVGDEIGDWKLDDKVLPENRYLIRNCLFVDEIKEDSVDSDSDEECEYEYYEETENEEFIEQEDGNHWMRF